MHDRATARDAFALPFLFNWRGWVSLSALEFFSQALVSRLNCSHCNNVSLLRRAFADSSPRPVPITPT